MRIALSARRHGIKARDMRHALRNPIATVDQDERSLVIGPAHDGTPLEIVVLDDWIIHAMELRPKFFPYLER